MMGFTGFSSRRQHSGSKAKRYDSDLIARAWANQQSADGRCPSSMSFEGGKFYSYSTVIAERIEYNGKTVFMVSDENYSPTTARHLNEVRAALRNRPHIFAVPGVDQGDSNLADLPRIFAAYKGDAERKLTGSGNAKRENKRSRLIVEAYQVWLKMRRLAEFFHMDLAEYQVKLPVPHKSAVDELTYARIIATRLADPSPWMKNPEPGVMVELPDEPEPVLFLIPERSTATIEQARFDFA